MRLAADRRSPRPRGNPCPTLQRTNSTKASSADPSNQVTWRVDSPSRRAADDAVLPVDDRSVLATHHDRRPGTVELGEGGDVPGVEPLHPQ